MTAIVAARGLSKVYRGGVAVTDVSFEIEAGEAVGLVGPNGAGKSTLLRMLCGALRPTSGTITVAGLGRGSGRSPGRRLGFVFDPPGIPGSLTARELVAVEAQLQGLPAGVARAAMVEYELQAFATRRFSKLSTGQRQRVALAAATLGSPDLLVLDEPTNGLDIEAIQWLRRLIDGRAQKGLTTIVSSHNLPELDRMTSRTLVLKKTILFDGTSLMDGVDDGEGHYLALIGVGAKAVR